MAGRIFISYRRADTAGPAGWLYDRLAGHFGRPQVVKDVDSIQLVDYTDRNHPYTKGYLGLYVESISDASSTAGAEFDNFTAAQL